MWWIFSLASALAQTSRNIVMKDLGHKLDEYINVLGRFSFMLPFALGISLIKGIPHVNSIYWFYSILAGFATTIATSFLSKAFKYAEISISIALWKTSVIFLLIMEAIIFGTKFSSLAIIGVIISCIGVYLLNIEKAHISFWKPITALVTDKGSRYGLLAAIFIAPSILLFKKTIELSDPFFPAFTNYLFATLFTLPAVIKFSRKDFKNLLQHWRGFVAMGFFAFLTTVLGNIGYSESNATYVEAIKQSEIIFTIIAGAFFLKEYAKIKEIWIGCMVICIGILFIVLKG